MKIVTGLFDPDDAMTALRGLTDNGFSYDDLSMISSALEVPKYLESEPEEAAVSGAAIGAVAGGSIGALGTLVASTIPGLESTFVAGLIATSAGGVIGGYLGSLYRMRAESQTEIDIHEELASGKLLLVVKTNESDAETAESLLVSGKGEHIEIHTVPED